MGASVKKPLWIQQFCIRKRLFDVSGPYVMIHSGAEAVAFAKEGADIAIVYLSEHAEEEKRCRAGRTRCVLIGRDIGEESLCNHTVEQTVKELGKRDILVNNAGEQHPQERIGHISDEQLQRIFKTNVLAMF
ncbi:SDR family oxidoreductase [Paenibacillus thiaminolyticus]|uniref:SDR family oxidoreductase n=1 Tax=Paenibacillus thiaminolyticus TaxID=49283 RepID=UPI003D2A759F